MGLYCNSIILYKVIHKTTDQITKSIPNKLQPINIKNRWMSTNMEVYFAHKFANQKVFPTEICLDITFGVSFHAGVLYFWIFLKKKKKKKKTSGYSFRTSSPFSTISKFTKDRYLVENLLAMC